MISSLSFSRTNTYESVSSGENYTSTTADRSKRWKRNMALTLLSLAIVYVAALAVSNLDAILMLFGALGGFPICYILPGYFYYKLAPSNTTAHTLSIWMMIFGTIIMIASIVYVLMELIP
ncbi:hypothetical protein SeMB42_g06445 [Synchytrium endobioticum]|uniref:Amino acid transporter transmembrane domain-containing protein n=1 Tax=Synchytrium endobioticum TaxID=286115 RepID=A0A507CLM8_9FUNG|nr:hypothetical protein SeMB42_g06445 [Synchytrium endobioticum]TPX41214.1 hypothetical protein SeLEV6574_g06207 [Synchytrium endobioticum]